MKKSIALIASVAGIALGCVAAWAAERGRQPEADVLPASAYRVPLDDIVVRGQQPYWHREQPPRWDAPKVEAPKPGDTSGDRLQWAPRYTREEREDYNGPRDQMHHPEARTKLFEIHF